MKRKSGNGLSLHGKEDIRIKELLTTYLWKQPHQSLNYSRSGVSSFDKHCQATHVSSTSDIYAQNCLKFHQLYPQQAIVGMNKNKTIMNLKKSSLHKRRLSHYNNTTNMNYVMKGLKSEESYGSRQNSTVMNIVNNLNGDNLNQTGSFNKNVEINFNKYEIKILSNKKNSKDKLEVGTIKNYHSKEIEVRRGKYQNDIKRNDNPDNIIVVDIDKELNKKDNTIQVINQEMKGNSKKHPILIQKQLLTEKEITDIASNVINLNEPVKESRIAQLNDANISIIENDDKLLLTPTKKRSDNIEIKAEEDIIAEIQDNNKNPQNINIETDVNIYHTSNVQIPNFPHFKCSMSISYQTGFSYFCSEYNIMTKQNTVNQWKLSIQTEGENHGNNLPIITPLKLNDDFINSSLRKRKSKDEDYSIEIKDSQRITSRRELSKFCKSRRQSIMADNPDLENDPLHQISKVIDSSDISDDDEECFVARRRSSSTINTNFVLNNLRNKNFKNDINQEHTSTEATNNHSSKNSSNIANRKDNSGRSFLLRRSTTHMFTSVEKSKTSSNPFKIKLITCKKKNKRLLRQLSKISEITNKKQKSPKKDKLVKSLSVPLVSIDKILNGLLIKIPSRKLSQVLLKNKMKLSLSQNESVDLHQKSIIKEEEQLSGSDYSRELSSPSVKAKNELKKKPSVISNSTSAINYCDLRTNSININIDLSRCLTVNNNAGCQHFIEKFIKEIQPSITFNNIYSTEAKNDQLNKAILSIDLKCEKLEDHRRRTITMYADKTLFLLAGKKDFGVKDFFNDLDKYIDEKYLEKELDKIDEYTNYFESYNAYSFTNHTLLLAPLRKKYFEVNIIQAVDKHRYLVIDDNAVKTSLISNFSLKKNEYKKLRTSISIQNGKKLQHAVTFKLPKTQKYIQTVNDVFCFRFIKMDDAPIEDKSEVMIDYSKLPFKKKSTKSPKKTYKRNESKIQLRGKMPSIFKRNNTLLSNSSKKTNDDNGLCFKSSNRRDSVLRKQFYLRQRDSLDNQKFDNEVNASFYQRIALSKQREKELFMSPLRSREEGKRNNKKRATLIAKDILHFNKESVMFNTYEIKTKLLSEMKSNIDSMFFYVQDANFQTFKDMFLKYKVSSEEQDKYGNSFLNLAVQCGSDKIVEFLLNNGANVNSQNRKMNTPLHYALSHQNFSLADNLIKFGANEQLKNLSGKAPWECLSNRFSYL